MRDTPTLFHSDKKTGFNLIEATIVLGIVGLVIGAIWVVGSKISFDRRINEMAQAAIFANRKMQEAFPNGLRPTAAITTGEGTTLAKTIGALPNSWEFSPSGNGWVRHPLGGDTKIAVRADVSPSYITVGYFDLSKQACIALLSALSISQKSDSAGILYILYGEHLVTTFTYSTATPAYQQGSTNCPNNNSGQVSIYFKF